MAKPMALAIARLVQWVVSPGGAPSVRNRLRNHGIWHQRFARLARFVVQ
jgi:hypothetical protein